MRKFFNDFYDPADQKNFYESHWFSAWQRKIYSFALTYYVGLAMPLRITGKLAHIWTDFNRALIENGKIAIVEIAEEWFLAKVLKGIQNFQKEWIEVEMVLLNEASERKFTPLPNSFVIFFWNSTARGFSLSDFHQELCELWKTKHLINYDQERSKKRLAIHFETDPGEEELKKLKENIDKGYLTVIAPEEESNEIKDFRWLETHNSAERKQLWEDKNNLWNEMCFFLGIRHAPVPSRHVERQNNPEISANQSYFDSWENERLEKLVEGLLELQSKPWGKDCYVLLRYGDLAPTLIQRGEFRNFSSLEEAQQSFLVEEDKTETKTNLEV